MMIKRLDKRSRILVEVIIFSLFISIVSTSYAYFMMASVTEGKQNVITSGSLELAFVDGPAINVKDVLPGDTIDKTFKVKNVGTIDTTYDVYFSETMNNFADKEDLVYTVESQNGCSSITEQVVPSEAGTKLVNSCSITAGSEQSYTIHIIFKETNNNQNDNIGKTFSTRLAIDGFKIYANNMPSEESNISVDKKVLNVNSLRTSNAKVGDIVETEGYYDYLDGGQAYYSIETKDAQIIDDGKYIELDNGNVASLMSINNAYNLRQFGAKGDGVSDDGAIIKKAIKASNDKSLYIPNGTYMVASKQEIHNISNVTIVGSGSSSVIKAMDNFENGSVVLYLVDVNGLNISNLTMDGNVLENTFDEGYGAKIGVSLIDVWGGSNITVDNCTFQNNAYAAIRLIYNEKNLYVTNSNFINVDCGIIHMGNTGSGDNWWIENNTFNGHENSEPVSIMGGSAFSNIHIIKNVMKNKESGSGINFIKNGTDVSYTNIECIENEIENMASGINMYNGEDILIKGNIINNMVSGQGINILTSNGVEIDGNYVADVWQKGFSIKDSKNIDAHDNTIVDSGKVSNDYFFVDIRGENENVEFYNNTVERKDNTLYQYALVLHGDGGVKVYDNTFINAKILLYKDSSNMYVANNGCEVSDRGTNNTVIQ